MFKYLFTSLLLLMVTGVVQADKIDLECDKLAAELFETLSQERLLSVGVSTDKVQVISRDLCARAEESAQLQYEKGRQEALDNWFLEDMGNKPGNERLKRIKR